MQDILSFFDAAALDRKLVMPYVIAEAGVNHEGSMELAKRLVREAAEGGADAIKFQSYKAGTLASKDSPAYWDTTKEPTKSQYELFKKHDSFWKKEFEELKRCCDDEGIAFMSTPFDVESARFLDPLMDVFKISSSDITNKPFIEFLCDFGKPIILSTGASSLHEVAEAVEWIEAKGNKLSHTTMANMIRNPKYKGYYVGNKVKVVDMFTKKQAFLPESEWVMYKDETGEIVPAIVSEEMWELANRVLEMRSLDVKTKQHKTVHQNLLTGKLWCAHCGKPYYRKDSVSPKGTRCSIWKCSNKIKNGADSCPSCSIYESEIVPILDDVFRSAQDNIASLSDLIQSLSRELLQKDNMSDVIKQLNDTVATEQKKKQKLLQLNIEGKFPDSEFIRMTAECDAEIAKAQEEIDRLTDSIKQKKDVNDQMEQIRKILLLAQKSLSKENIDRSFVDQFIKRITVHVENPETHENPVKMRLEIELNTGKSLEKSLIKTLIHRGQRSNVICPVRHIEFSRVSRKEKQQKMVITYEYSLAV